MSAEDELRDTLRLVADAFERLGVRWAIGGSFASTVYGEPRATNDVDIVASLRLAHVEPFVAALGSRFYADAIPMQEAIRHRESFNIIDEKTFLKIDIFVPPSGAIGEDQLARRRRYSLSDQGPDVFVLGPEDTVLQKLRWFELGGGVSDRQWRDILSVLRIVEELDIDYMRATAQEAALSMVLDRALSEAGRR